MDIERSIYDLEVKMLLLEVMDANEGLLFEVHHFGELSALTLRSDGW